MTTTLYAIKYKGMYLRIDSSGYVFVPVLWLATLKPNKPAKIVMESMVADGFCSDALDLTIVELEVTEKSSSWESI